MTNILALEYEVRKVYTYIIIIQQNIRLNKHWLYLLSGFYNITVTRVPYKRKSFSCLGKFFVFMCTDSMSTKSSGVGAMAMIPALESKSDLTKHSKRINVTFNYIMNLLLPTIFIY